MKQVAILLLFALVLASSGCSNTNNTTTVSTTAGNVWSSAMEGGSGTSSGFSFIAQFTISGAGGLSILNFQLNNAEADTCFQSGTITESGTLNLTNLAGVVNGTFSFTITSSAGDVITLTSSTVTGTYDSTTAVLTGGSIVGTWALAPASGTPCVATSGSFTMTES